MSRAPSLVGSGEAVLTSGHVSHCVAFADAACAPVDFPIAPAKAVPVALKRAGLTIDQIAKFEVNEAFSAVALANQKILNIPSEKINVNGGAVALGHALGSSGSRIIVTLVHLLKPGEYGVAGVCNVSRLFFFASRGC